MTRQDALLKLCHRLRARHRRAVSTGRTEDAERLERRIEMVEGLLVDLRRREAA